jgi:hypothetical protein
MRVFLLLLAHIITTQGFHIPYRKAQSKNSVTSTGFVSIRSVDSKTENDFLPFASTLSMVNSDFDEESIALSTPANNPLLAAIDFAALVVFAGIGKASHSADGSLDIQGILTTAFPFLVAWFATSPFTGIYDDRNGQGVIDAGKVAAKGWIIAIPIGCVLRGVIRGYVPPLPFVIVTMIVTLVILGGSRMLFTIVDDKISSSEDE